MSGANEKACVVSIEVDGRQSYIFESDKLQEMLGASRLIDQTRDEAWSAFDETKGLFLFSPVSGEIKAWCYESQRQELLGAAWQMREWLEERGIEHTVVYLECCAHHFNEPGEPPPNWNTDDETEPKHPSLVWVYQELGRRSRQQKDAKAGEDARPRNALFASCQIHGFDAANHWYRDGPKPAEDETRRRQVGFRSEWKRSEWNEFKRRFYGEQFVEALREHVRRRANVEPTEGWEKISFPAVARITFSDFAPDPGDDEKRQDSYIGFACADGDGMGKLLGQLDWNTPRWGDDKAPWERNRDFAAALDHCLKAAFRQAINDVLLPDVSAAKKLANRLNTASGGKRAVRLPLLPQLLGGDDLWLVGRRSEVIDLALAFERHYGETAGKDEVLTRALEAAGLAADQGGEKLTLSFGLCFAKAGYPAHAMISMAEALLRSAKRLRKGKLPGRAATDEGCLDWHWVESSLSESLEEARARWSYVHDGSTLHLTTRPWAASTARKHVAAARNLAALPRGKREQLETVLRLGERLSVLAWEGWRKRLTKEEWEHVEQVARTIGAPAAPLSHWVVRESPWIVGEGIPRELETPFLDLLALEHVLDLERREEDAPPEQQPTAAQATEATP